MSSEDLDSALNSTPGAKSRKRKTDSGSPISSENEGEIPPMPPKIFGNIGTPMPSTSVAVADADEWEEWKKKEMEKRAWKKYLRSKWDLKKDELPRKSDSVHYQDRQKHYKNVYRAQDEVCEGLEAINELHFNVGKGEAVNVQINGKQISKKKSKKFAAAVEKALAEMGNPSMAEMMTDDLDDEEEKKEASWAKKFAKKSAKTRHRQEMMREMEVEQSFDPWEEYCVYMEAKGKPEKIEEKHFRKWLEKKIEENKVSKNFNAYQLELLKLDKDGLKARPTSLKSVVKGVANFYRKMRRKK